MLSRSILLAALAAVLAPAQELTALDRYVRSPDASFRYQLISQSSVLGTTTYVLEMVSQNWLSAGEADRPEWKHWLVITRPAQVASETALLYVNGGSNDSKAPAGPDPLAALVALETGVVVADLRMVPNQPLRFADGRPRSEDALIAYTWLRFLETGDERWPARLPMTKAAVRAMDTVQSFLAGEGGVRISRFILTGGSKRGWTTWTAAAVDRRVVAIVPVVIDVLNVQRSFEHHWRAYGAWSPAINDYAEAGLMAWLGTERFGQLMQIEDPYEYRERLTLPKYIVNASGDEFFLPDSSRFYFEDLPGEKYLRYIPNADHGGAGSLETAYSLVAYVQSILNNVPRPRFYWRADRESGTIRVFTLDAPSEVRLWQATNPEARDFRVATIGRAWKSGAVKGEDGIYTVTLPRPDNGWTAFFLELTFPNGGRYPWVFTTEVVVTPDTYPYESPVRTTLSRR